MIDPRRAARIDQIVQEETARSLESNPGEEVVLVCTPEGGFADDLSGTCSVCGRMVRFRPTAPDPSRKVCIACWPGELAKTPPEDVEQHQDWLRRTLGRIQRETGSN